MPSPTDTLNAPTYMKVFRANGKTYLGETLVGASLQDAIKDIDDDLFQVLMVEDWKIVDASTEAAEMWLALNAHELETVFDCPDFVMEQIPDQVHDVISSSRYEAHLMHEHERSFARVL